MGEAVLRTFSAETVRAILAHEVGHAAQPESARERLRMLLGLPALMLVASATILAAFGFEGAGASLGAIGAPMLCWHVAGPAVRDFEKALARELDADERAARIVGAEAVAHALMDYARQFAPGPMQPMTRLRLLHLRTLDP